ncbi:MAG: ribonucleoside-diphosphate reductase, adenosylcobalamin-dependent, partial [Nitrosomonas sp.]
SCYTRRVLQRDGCYADFPVTDYAAALWRKDRASDDLPAAFVTAHELTPAEHLSMQAAIQPYVDQAISKTINIPADYGFAQFSDLYRQAYDLGLKGCTTFRPNAVTGEILHKPDAQHAVPHCCGLGREAD